MGLVLFLLGIAAVCYYLSWYFRNTAKQTKKKISKKREEHIQKANAKSSTQPKLEPQIEQKHEELPIAEVLTVQEILPTPKEENVKLAEDYIKELEEAKKKREIEKAHYDIVFVDIEATSYDQKYAERNDILQIAIIDKYKNVIINQYCKPKKKTWERASNVNSIYPKTVENCPNFRNVKPYIEDILNHSSKVITFDVVFVRDYFDKYKVERKVGMESPVYQLREYNRAMGIENPQWTTLEDAKNQLGLTYISNDALEDAKAIADVYAYVKEQENAVRAEQLKNKVDNSVKNKYVQNVNADKSNYFYNKKIAFVDTLPISREEAFEKVSDRGALIRLTVSATLDILVCGTRSTMMRHLYGEISSEQKKAEKLNASGANIEIMTGESFMALLD